VSGKKLNIILGSHAHVPSGSPESEYEYLYVNKMRPFVSNLYRYSNIQAVLHYSGVLLYWIERNHPEFFMLIEDMVSRKQIEILGGGFYEPMFPLIPPQDRIGQVELLTTYLRKHFGKRPLGCWIPFFAWEQHLAASFSASGMDYTFLSKDQFLQAGLSGEDLYYPCITEDQGKLIKIFPVSSQIEEELIHSSFTHVIDNFLNRTENEPGVLQDRTISIFPEKVLCSPEEAQEYAWNRFFEEVSLSGNIIETILPSKILKIKKTSKKASFPNSTSITDFSPRNFLIENCETNGIYSKMIFVNVLISQLRGDKSRKQNAREELWKAQDSCLFTPGNKKYGSDLRKTAYSSLLRAEKLSREKNKSISPLVNYDFDFDGNTEYLFQGALINCYIQLTGAGIFELDYLPKDWNYLDCGSFKCPGENTDKKRTAFADVILHPDTELTDIENKLSENARILFNEKFEAVTEDRKGKSCFFLPACDADVPFGSIEVNKCFLLKKDSLSVSYSLKNCGNENNKFIFFTEVDFSFAGIGEDYVRFYTVENGEKDIPAEKTLDKINILKILDVINEVQLIIKTEKEFSGSLIHVFNENQYQVSRIITFFPVNLDSGKTWTNEFNLKLSH